MSVQALSSAPKLEPSQRKAARVSLMSCFSMMILVALFVPICYKPFTEPAIGETSEQVRAKMGPPNKVYNSALDQGRGSQNGWTIRSTDKWIPDLMPPRSQCLRWDYTVGLMQAEFYLIEFENGRVVEVYVGGT